MDRREQLGNIIRSIDIDVWSKFHCYPNIGNKVLAKITKHFDPRININNVVAFLDCSIGLNSKRGTVFTLYGIYDKQLLEKPYYFNYSDIDTYYLKADKKGRTDGLNGTLVVKLKNGHSYETQDAASVLKATLDYIFPIVIAWDNTVSTRPSGEIHKLGLTEGQLKKCHGIIHAASVAAGGVGTGLAQIPLSDNAIITPIQIAMITSLGLVFDIRVTEGAAKAILGSMLAAFVGRSVSQLLAGWIPGLGNVVNTATAAGITEAIGWVAVKHFCTLNEEERAKFRVEGMKAGYEAASDEYEAKLRNQAEAFIKQKEIAAEQFKEYEDLLKEYEDYITKLEVTINSMKASGMLEIPQETIESLHSLKQQYSQLRDLKVIS